jgi:hypothetical protein
MPGLPTNSEAMELDAIPSQSNACGHDTPGMGDLRQGASRASQREAPERVLDVSNPRPIKAHRRRSQPIPTHWRPDYYTPSYSILNDRNTTLRNSPDASPPATMADDARDDRGDSYRGDSYRGGGNKRRRDGEPIHASTPCYANDCADEDSGAYRDDRRGPQRRRRDDGPPRRRYEEPPFPKLRRLLLNIASSTKLPQDEAIEIAKYFGENFDDERLRSDFFDVFVQLYVLG